MNVGKRITLLLAEREMQQKELAQKINMDTSVLSRIINGRRPVRSDELSSIANAFHVTTDFLLGRITEEQERKVQKIARQIADAKTPPPKGLTSGLLAGLPGLGDRVDELSTDDPRRDVIEKVAGMDEQSVKAVKGIVDALASRQTPNDSGQ